MKHWTMALTITSLVSAGGLACTTFEIPQSETKVVAKSFDWNQDHGLVVINKRHVAKQALSLLPLGPVKSWTSKYGSLTFDQVGRDFPLSGINEKGLVMEIMWLDSSIYEGGQKPSVNEFQFIQYLLDSAADVKETLALAGTVRVDDVFAKVHWLACDAGGACASFEYIDGKLVTHAGADLPVPTLTNDTYAASLSFLQQHVGFGGSQPIPRSPASLDRFAQASARARDFKGGDAVAYAFETLSLVSQGDYSKWNLVYEPTVGKAHFRTLHAPAVKDVSLADFDFSCKSPVRVLDINTPTGGEAGPAFVDYTREANARIVEETLKPLGNSFPPGVAPLVATYPEKAVCQD